MCAFPRGGWLKRRRKSTDQFRKQERRGRARNVRRKKRPCLISQEGGGKKGVAGGICFNWREGGGRANSVEPWQPG